LSRRQEEIANSEDWSKNNIDGKHFLLAAEEPPETLLDLLFPSVRGPDARKKVYLSFPITHADETIRHKKADFLQRLRKHWVVFDPGSVTEYDVALNSYRAAASGRAEDASDQREWVEKLGPITVDNDFRLIDQCDGIAVYYPSTQVKIQNSEGAWVEAEHKVLSAGVIAEMIHAKGGLRSVEALWLSDQVPSPFFSRFCDQPIFRTEEEFFERLS
jgi:hypothetical protein